MPNIQRPPAGDPEELRITIPPALLDLFKESPRILIKYHLPGLLPIDPTILGKINLQELVAKEEFNKNFDIVIVPKG